MKTVGRLFAVVFFVAVAQSIFSGGNESTTRIINLVNGFCPEFVHFQWAALPMTMTVERHVPIYVNNEGNWEQEYRWITFSLSGYSLVNCPHPDEYIHWLFCDTILNNDIPNSSNTVSVRIISTENQQYKFSIYGHYTGVHISDNGQVWNINEEVRSSTEYRVTFQTDSTGPSAPTASLSCGGWTNQNVTVTAENSTDSQSGFDRYQLWNGSTWIDSATQTFTENGSGKMRAVDKLGNVSEETNFSVGNIDRANPSAPVITTMNGIVVADSLNLSWNKSTDGGSEVAYYWVEMPGFARRDVYDTSTFFANLTEGIKTAQVCAVDKAGNQSDWSSIDVKVDQSPPVISGLSATVMMESIDGVSTPKVTVSCKITDAPTDSSSGLETIGVTVKNGQEEVYTNTLSQLTEDCVWAFPLSCGDRNKSYSIIVVAKDQLDHGSSATAQCMTPSGSIDAAIVGYSSDSVNGVPVYSTTHFVNCSSSYVSDTLSAVEKFCICLADNDTEVGEILNTGNASYSIAATMSGKAYAHKNVSFFVKTVYRDGQTESGVAYQSTQLSNIIPRYNLVLERIDGQTIVESWILFSTAGAATAPDRSFASCTKDYLRSLRVRIDPVIDVENDTLKPVLYFGQQTYYPVNGDASTISLSRFVSEAEPEDFSRSFGLGIQESSGSWENVVQVDNSGFSLLLDTAKPVFSNPAAFISKVADREIVFTEASPTRWTAVKIRSVFASDQAGMIHSGIAAYRIGNSVNTLTSFPWNGEGELEIGHTLTSGDGKKTVILQIVDKAGNVQEQTLNTVLDTTAPVANGDVFSQARYHAGKIELLWNQDGERFIDAYTRPESLRYRLEITKATDLAVVAHIDEQRDNWYSLDPRNLPANTRLLVTVQAVDSAGNTSITQTYPYLLSSPSTCGSVELVGAVVDPNSYRYTLTFDHVSSQNAKSEFLRVWKKDQEPSIVISLDQDSGDFIVTGVEKRTTTRYQLFALNDCNFEIEGETGKIPLVNAKPKRPESLAPKDFSRVDPIFSWQGERNDLEGDPISYTFMYSLISGEDGNSISLGSTLNFSSSGNDQIRSILVDGVTLFWTVEATDGFDTVRSEEASVKIDAVAPNATIQQAGMGDLFTNADVLRLALNDQNGIKEALYSSSDGHATNLSAEFGNDGAGGYTATIPLHTNDAKEKYKIICQVYDLAGNKTEVTSTELRVDRTAPTLDSVTQNAPLVGGISATTTGLFTISSSGQDDYSGLKKIEYGFLTEIGGIPTFVRSAAVRPVPSPDGDWEPRTFTVPVTLTGVDGTSYFIAARAVDFAGNVSVTRISSLSVLLDTTAPEVAVKISGLSSYGSGYFLASMDALTVESSCQDVNSVAVKEFAAVERSDGAVSPIWRSTKEAAFADLIPGKSYAVGVRGTNAAGGIATALSAAFTYDPTAPTGLSIESVNTEDLVAGEQVRFRVSATDPESGIQAISVGIGATAGGTELTALVPGNVGGYLTRKGVDGLADFRFDLPPMTDGTYYLSLRAMNGAGLMASEQAAGVTITVTGSTEKMVVTDQGPCGSSGDHLRASWFYNGSMKASGYRYRIVGPDGAVTDWTATAEESTTAEGLSLEHGKTYRFEVEAAFADGPSSASGSSRGVTLDLTAPAFAAAGGFVTPTASTSGGLRIGWNVTDAESGIAAMEAVIETYGESGELVRIADPIPLAARESTTGIVISADGYGNPLNLVSGKKAILTLRATNGAGATADVTAPAVTIDDTEPPVPLVRDQGDVINTGQVLEANWIWSLADPESGTTGFEWTIVPTPSSLDAATWHEAGEERTATLYGITDPDAGIVQVHLKTWYFAVRARNAAGLTSVGLSDGIVYDETAPYVARVMLINANDQAENPSELNYITSTADLAVFIDSQDDVAQKMGYRVDAGILTGGVWSPKAGVDTIESTDSKILVSGITMGAGEIVSFRGMVLNEAGLVSEYGYTQGMVLSTDIPNVTAVHGRMQGNDLYFDWDATAQITPIQKYYTALVPVAAASTEPPASQWKDCGLAKTVSFNKATDGIADGEYVLLVKARNIAGAYSDPAKRSSVVTFDDTPAAMMSVGTPKYASTKVALSATAVDQQSGIQEYLYSVGTFSDPTAFSDGWISRLYGGNLLTTDVMLAEIPAEVPDGAVLHISVRARNGAGLWSEEKTGTAISIDKTPASTPTVTAGNYTTYKTRVEGIGYGSSDTQSGITLIKIAPVGSLGAPMPGEAELISVGSDTNFTAETAVTGFVLYGLDLAEAGRYHVAVQARNGAGDWSAVGYSTVVIVDTIAPSIVFEDGTGKKVVNEGPTTVAFTLSEPAGSNVTFLKPGGAADQGPIFDSAGGADTLEFPYTAEGTYSVSAVLTDPAGNVGNIGGEKKSLSLRINAAPRVYLSTYETTPGKPRLLTANVFDIDGDAPLSYLWTFGDGNGTSTEESPTHPYLHSGTANQRTEYTVTLTVTDALGKATTRTDKVVIENTVYGTLYVDEYWSGNREIRGDITVPAGITLLVAPGTQVLATGAFALLVNGILTADTGAVFGRAAASTTAWKGIAVTGTATLTGTEVREAQRGLTALPGSTVTVTGCVFKENTTGVHAYGSNPQIGSTAFRDNERYGVKEDAGGRPRLTGCLFGGNLYDYYGETDAVISVGKLNTINGSSGNAEE